MRKIYITRGIPGSGKSTFIHDNNLEAYTLSPDTIRLTYGAPVMNIEGRIVMPSKDDRAVWEHMRERLEARMTRGELVVIDATHTAASYFSDYAKLIQKYRYTAYVVDFTSTPLSLSKERNRNRVAHKVVDDSVLESMHQRLQTFSIPKGFTLITPAQVSETLKNSPVDLSHYKRIHHIGDIQGCFKPLKNYFDDNLLKDDEYYIFTGDLLDRGPDNAEVLQYICEHFVNRSNVAFVEGNHDLYIWQWLTKQPVTAREFNGRTKTQLEAAAIDKPAVSRLLRSMVEAFHYTFGNRTVLVSHAGISALPEQLALISAEQCIRGTGKYEDVGVVDDQFVKNTNENTYQIHGHRNQQDFPTKYNERCFNLEGKVEFGGDLRIVQLDQSGFSVADVPNRSSTLTLHPENASFIHSMRTNRLISEKQLPGGISSFHFKSEVFFDKKWTDQTISARGLFINTLTNEIVIRAYDKFFNIGERRDTEMSALASRMKFPAKAWVKENGYLGVIGYDAVSGELVIASKSTTESEFAGWFSELFHRLHGQYVEQIKTYLATTNTCLVFEVILPGLDPHIVDYPADRLVLLDIVKRQKDFSALWQDEREAFAASIGVPTKQLAAEFSSWGDFEEWYSGLKGLDFTHNGTEIEGFVIEDAEHFQVKVKLDFYTFWKQLRSALDALKNGREAKVKSECEYPELAQQVIDFMRTLTPSDLQKSTILSVRRDFQKT